MNILKLWQDRTTVVCGGSSGLGLELVKALARQSARIAILGRDSTRLKAACEQAIQLGAPTATGFSIDGKLDIHSTPEGQRYLEWLQNNGIDLLINAIGRSDRGRLEQLSIQDLDGMFQDNVTCTWNMTRMALKSLRENRGVVVNIGSLAGLVPAPNMGAYSVAKFALTALTRQWRLELEADGVHVMLVSPGPIARNDSSHRYEALTAERGLDKTAAAPAGGAKLKLLDPTILAEQILTAAHQRKKELVLPGKARWLAAIMNLSADWGEWILKRYTRQ